MMQINPDTQAALALAIARLRSMRAIECLSALLAASALLSVFMISASVVARSSLALSLGAAILLAYACIRVRIDVALFERWEQLDVAALDRALILINPDFQGERSLQSRIDGSLMWWRRGLVVLCVQLGLCVAAVLLT